MSQEVLRDPMPVRDTGATVGDPPAVLELDVDPDAGPPPVARRAWRRRIPERWLHRSVTPLTLVGVVAAALGLGVLAGGSQAHRDDLDQQLAGTRVLLWTDGGPVDSDPAGTGISDGLDLDADVGADVYAAADAAAGGLDRSGLEAVLTSTGSVVQVERVELGVGQGTPQQPLTLQPGGRQTAMLRLQPDCELLGRSGARPAALASARAVVRVPGSSRTRRVPLDVLGDPSAMVLSLASGCPIGDYPVTDQDGPPAVVVSEMSATRAGRLSFTVTPPSGLLGRFELALAEPAGAWIQVRGMSRPGTPLPLTGGRAVRVSVELTARCTGPTVPITYGVLQPQVHARRTLHAMPVQGWDDGVASAAVAAAAVRACYPPAMATGTD